MFSVSVPSFSLGSLRIRSQGFLTTRSRKFFEGFIEFIFQDSSEPCCLILRAWGRESTGIVSKMSKTWFGNVWHFLGNDFEIRLSIRYLFEFPAGLLAGIARGAGISVDPVSRLAVFICFFCWQANWKANLETILTTLIRWLVPAALSCIRKYGVELVPVEENSKVM